MKAHLFTKWVTKLLVNDLASIWTSIIILTGTTLLFSCTVVTQFADALGNSVGV